jgi:hypothetical protein
VWLGTWEGAIHREPGKGSCSWLRVYDGDKNLVLLPHEIAEKERQKAEKEHQKAERFAQRLRELGEDPDSFF